MTINLLFESNARVNSDIAWPAIQKAAGYENGNKHGKRGIVTLSDDTVDRIASLLTNVKLTNGQPISSFYFEPDVNSFAPSSMVCTFGPSLLPTPLQDQVRDLLAADDNGTQAVRLFNEVITFGLQVGFMGTEHFNAHMQASNWHADDVEINRCESNMLRMLSDLGLNKQQLAAQEVSIDTFLKAVNDKSHCTDHGPRLKEFAACAIRNQATKVYWA